MGGGGGGEGGGGGGVVGRVCEREVKASICGWRERMESIYFVST